MIMIEKVVICVPFVIIIGRLQKIKLFQKNICFHVCVAFGGQPDFIFIPLGLKAIMPLSVSNVCDVDQQFISLLMLTL